MSWPALVENVKTLDLSQYQNWANSQPDRVKGRIDFEDLAVENPEVKIIIIRACATSYIDADWEYNWRESAGFHKAAYVNNDPTWAVNGPQGEMWKKALGDKEHKAIVYDCESRFGRSPQTITKDIREGLDLLRTNWPSARMIIYTAEWFWKNHIVHGWEENEDVWVAHYPYMIQRLNGSWRVVYSFAEMDPFLPISNNFTPRVPTGFKKENVKGWQITNSGIIKPIAQSNLKPRTDLNYFLKEWADETWEDDIVVPPLPPPSDPTLEERFNAFESWGKEQGYVPPF